MTDKLEQVLRSGRFWQTLTAVAVYLLQGEIQDINLTVEGLAGYTVAAHVGSDRLFDLLVRLGVRE